jgi:hypothetical protein
MELPHECPCTDSLADSSLYEIRNTGSGLRKMLNFYSPPAYTREGEEISRGKILNSPE